MNQNYILTDSIEYDILCIDSNESEREVNINENQQKKVHDSQG